MNYIGFPFMKYPGMVYFPIKTTHIPGRIKNQRQKRKLQRQTGIKLKIKNHATNRR